MQNSREQKLDKGTLVQIFSNNDCLIEEVSLIELFGKSDEIEIKVLYNCGRIFLYYHFSLVISYHSVWLGLELFGLVHVQVHTLSAVHARARRMWQSQMS